METLVLRSLVIQFDGQVVEVFGLGDTFRRHVAVLKPVGTDSPDSNGRVRVHIGNTEFRVGADEWPSVADLVARINQAVSAARP